MKSLSMLLLLGACGSVNLASIVQLSHLHPLTANPSGFAAAVVLPHEMDVPENGAMLSLVWTSAEETIGGDFPLRRHSALEGSGIAPDHEQQVIFFDLSAQNAAKMRQAQQDIIAREDMGIDGEGSFSVFAAPCLRGVTASTLISTYLRIEEGGRFLPLLQDFDVGLEMTQGALSGLENCD